MIKKLLFSLAVLSGAAPIHVAAQDMPQSPEIAARAYLLLDVSSSQQLAAKEADTQIEPASLTKLMTAYLVFDALRLGKLELSQRLPVSQRAWHQPGSRMFIDPSMKVPVEDLIKGLLVQSGNDAAMVLAEAVGGSAGHFVQLMNEQAQALGMESTHFLNPTGLHEPGHLSSAHDLGILATRLLRDFPDFARFHAIRKYRYQGTPPANDSNRNLLLYRDPSVDGLKTGHTDAAGFCLIATAQREFPNLGPAGADGPRRLLAIVLGAESENARAIEAQKLLNWGYTAFEAVKLFEANQAIVTPVIWKGKSAQARLGRPQQIVVAVPAGTASRLRTQAIRPDPLLAPLAKGQVAGMLNIYVGEHVLSSIPLMALEKVDEAGLIGRAWDAFRLWMK